MKKYLSIILGFALSGCIQEEALNTEADIVKIEFPQSIDVDNVNYNEPFSEDYNAFPIYVNVPLNTNLNELVLVYKVTAGATLYWPDEGVNYNDIVKLKVVSQDQQYSKDYAIIVKYPERRSFPEILEFENCKTIKYNENANFHEFYEIVEGENMNIWSSGNLGFALTGLGKEVDNNPTYQDEEGRNGKCAKLVTRSTGAFGKMGDMYMAAGNLFLGNFDVSSALEDALGSTRFGVTCTQKPLRVRGWYKYKPGTDYQKKGESVNDGSKDAFSINAIFYKTDENFKSMDGHDATINFEGEHRSYMIAHQKLRGQEEKLDWTSFDIELDYSKYDAAIDRKALAEGKYKFGLCFSSSEFGDIFEGAIGSTLWIDDVEIIFEDKE